MNNTEKRIIRLYNNGLSYPKIANILCMGLLTVRNILTKNNIKIKTRSDYRDLSINNLFFKNIDDHTKAQVLGFLYADGCNNIDNGCFRVNISVEDIKYLRELVNTFSKDIKVNIRNVKSFGINRNKQATFTVYSIEMCKDLEKLGCIPRKSLVLKFPSELQVPFDFLNSFILGYFEGDGGFSMQHKKIPGMTFRICSTENFCNSLYNIFSDQLGIKGNIYRIKNGHGMCHFSICGTKKIQRVCDWLYKDFKFCMKRKFIIYKRLQKYLKKKYD